MAMRHRRHVSGPRRAVRNDRGAVAVEAALITPLLLLIVFGIIEMSLFMRDVVSVSSSVHVGTRMASVSAGAGPATCTPSPCTPPNAPFLAQIAANGIQKAGTAMPQDQINFILVYRSNTQGYPLPEGNTSAVCSTDCVRYQWSDTLNQFTYNSGSWTSSQINACVNHPGLMSVGVIMDATHPWVTGMFDPTHITEHSVMQFEPLDNDSCLPGKHL